MADAPSRPLITLLTDFGTADGYVGALKGVILSLNPGAVLVDLSHQVPPQDILAGALVLRAAAPYFPSGSIHLAVVDPGVGTVRRGLALRCGPHTFVGPDNGLFTLVLAAGPDFQAVSLQNPAYFLPRLSPTFHGRDLFAPVAAHLSLGVPLNDLGPPVTDPVRLLLPAPRVSPQAWVGEILHVDHFGNLISNIPFDALLSWAQGRPIAVRLGGGREPRLVQTYGEAGPGEWVALGGSHGYLEIARVQGSAAGSLGNGRGLPVEVRLAED